MNKQKEYLLLDVKLESLQERLELKQQEVAEIVKDYMAAYKKYIILTKELFGVDFEDNKEV